MLHYILSSTISLKCHNKGKQSDFYIKILRNSTTNASVTIKYIGYSIC